MRRDLIALNDQSKVWVYQCNTEVSDEVEEAIKSKLYDFTMFWNSHGKELDCYANLFHKRFLVFVADDSNHIGGCSIDSSVHLIKQFEQDFNLNFFDRLTYSYVKNDEFHFIHSSAFAEAYKNGSITDETLMVNNLVNTKEAFLTEWIIPLSDSWYKKMLN